MLKIIKKRTLNAKIPVINNKMAIIDMNRMDETLLEQARKILSEIRTIFVLGESVTNFSFVELTNVSKGNILPNHYLGSKTQISSKQFVSTDNQKEKLESEDDIQKENLQAEDIRQNGELQGENNTVEIKDMKFSEFIQEFGSPISFRENRQILDLSKCEIIIDEELKESLFDDIIKADEVIKEEEDIKEEEHVKEEEDGEMSSSSESAPNKEEYMNTESNERPNFSESEIKNNVKSEIIDDDKEGDVQYFMKLDEYKDAKEISLDIDLPDFDMSDSKYIYHLKQTNNDYSDSDDTIYLE